MTSPVVLSYRQVEPLLAALRQGKRSAHMSTDLGLSEIEVEVGTEGIPLPDGGALSWQQIERIRESPNSCFSFDDGRLGKIQRFSAATNRLISLLPTERAPALLISGILMHRIKDIDPYRDTLTKVEAIAPIVGRVLDTSTGLGYTAIEAAKTAEEVVTVELDPAVLEVARCNPWSRLLFAGRNIVQVVGDSTVEVAHYPDEAFTRIVHDPPTFDLAGDMYAGMFYRELYRILCRGGRLFHYIGNLDSGSGRGVARGAMRRLQDAGFRSVVRRPAAFGLVAYK